MPRVRASATRHRRRGARGAVSRRSPRPAGGRDCRRANSPRRRGTGVGHDGQLFEDGLHVARQPGVVQTRGQVLGAAAIRWLSRTTLKPRRKALSAIPACSGRRSIPRVRGGRPSSRAPSARAASGSAPARGCPRRSRTSGRPAPATAGASGAAPRRIPSCGGRLAATAAVRSRASLPVYRTSGEAAWSHSGAPLRMRDWSRLSAPAALKRPPRRNDR